MKNGTIHIKERPQDMPLADRLKVVEARYISVSVILSQRFKANPVKRLLRRSCLIALAVFPGIPYAGLLLMVVTLHRKFNLNKPLAPFAWWQEQWEK